jgi:zinc protease
MQVVRADLKRHLWWVACQIAAVLFMPSPFAQAQTTDPDALIPMDAAVRQGVLPNGLRYALLSNDRPVGGLSIRLRFDVGSYEEPDGRGGIAHFLEHMAFNGTRGLAEGELARRFAEAGVAFGRDQNASTSTFATTYKVDLPHTDEATMALGFGWMRDIGDGLLLTPDAVARERGVVLAEHDGRLSPAYAWSQAYQAFAAPLARSRLRQPIGTPQSIRAIDAEALTEFHRTWYRPDNAVLTVVGDLPLDAMEARVRDSFSTWNATTEPLTRARATPFDLTRPLDVMTYASETLPTGLSACRLTPWSALGRDSFARRRTNIMRGLWVGILNRRLSLLAEGADTPFIAANVSWSPWTREANALCLSVTPPVGGDWTRAVTAALTEILRLEAHGVEAREIARIVDAQKRFNTTAVEQADDRYSETLSDALVSAFALHELDAAAFVHPRSIPAIYDAVVASIDADDVRDDFARTWNGSEPLISVVMPQPPDKEAVRAVWQQVTTAAPPIARTDEPEATWAYADMGIPGRVVSREVIAKPEFTRVRFDNGLVLNVKSAAFTRDLITMAVRLGDGRAGVANADYQTASIGAGFVNAGGLGKHSLRDIQNMFPDRRLGLSLQMLERTFQLSGSTRPSDLELQLQLTTALLSDPGFRDDFVGQRRQTIDAVYRAYRTQPGTVLSLALAEKIAPGSPRLLPPREAMDALTMRDFERLFRPVLTQAPLELTIVGDMPENDIIDMVGRTLGTLPDRTVTTSPREDIFMVRFGDDRPKISAVHEGPADQAIVSAIWPLFVSDPSRRREQRTLELLRAVLQDRVRDEVREALGATYSPSVSLSFDDFGDQGSMTVAVATSPADLERVREAVSRVVAEVASGTVTQSELDNVRAPILARIEDNRATNSWWFGTLNGSAREPQRLRDALEWEADYRNITLAELKAAAATWLSGPAIDAVAVSNAAQVPAS